MNEVSITGHEVSCLRNHLRQQSRCFFCLRHWGRGEHIRMVRKIFQTDSGSQLTKGILMVACLAEQVPADTHKP